jgi:hypothetical protein
MATETLATLPDPPHGGRPRSAKPCHDKSQNPLSDLVKHLARQAARQMFRDGEGLDDPLPGVDHVQHDG